MCTECRAVETEAAENLGVDRESVTLVHDAIKAAYVRRSNEERDALMRLVEDLPEDVAAGLRAQLEPEPEEPGDPIPSFVIEALVSSVGGPVVVVGATPLPSGESQLTVKAAGTGNSPALAARILTAAAETLDSPLATSGGVTEDGRIVFPMQRKPR